MLYDHKDTPWAILKKKKNFRIKISNRCKNNHTWFKILEACHAAEKKLKKTSFNSYSYIVFLILF